MSLPIRAVDRLFERLGATYGAQFLAMWRDVPIETVKAAWANELGGFAHRLEALAWALDHLPERPPNAVEFRALARMAPAPDVPQLERPAANPERAAAALRDLQISLRTSDRPDDALSWARRIMDRQAAGEYVHHATLALAKAAIARTQGVPHEV